MRSSTLVAAFVASVLLAGCENGPNQSFVAAAPDAGSAWNGANPNNTVGSTDPDATTGFENQMGGKDKINLCSGSEKAKKWADMVQQDIKPPRNAAGLDLAGDDTWTGLTIEKAEAINCQSDSQGDRFGNGDLVNSWGDNGEVWAEYRVSTRKVNFLTLWPGYVGKMDFNGVDANGKPHVYQIKISEQIKRDGQNFVFDWTGNMGQNFIAQGDEIYRALIHTYGASLPVEPQGTTCFDVGKCIKGAFGDVAYFYIPSIGWAFWIDNQHANQPVPSIATRLDLDLTKILPYAFSNAVLKMDAEGPLGVNPAPLGKVSKLCTLKMGLTYTEFLANCVQVALDNVADTEALNKLLGGFSHGTERFHFNVSGIDINFTDLSLPANDIIHDMDRPHPTDLATSFVVDQSTLGKIQNDRDVNGFLDLHGSGAVYQEYMRLVRKQLLDLSGIQDQPTRLSNCVYPPNYKGTEADFIAQLPPYCTGFEGFITAAPPTVAGDLNNLGLLNCKNTKGDLVNCATKVLSSMALGLKLGHTKAAFCWDATGDVTTGYTKCQDNGDIFSTSFNRVLKVFGRGKLSSLPTDCQDVRFFFKQYFTALAKYFTVGSQNPVPDLSQILLNSDDLFFDSIGAGQFEISEYVDRRFATLKQNPLDVVFTADVKNGIASSYSFSRDLFRGEESIYQAMLTDPTNDGLGQEETALLTNVFGSPVLQLWKDVITNGVTYSAYHCATVLDPANCNMQKPPLDANGKVLIDERGRPVLAPYPGAFGSARTAFTLGVTPIKVTQTYPNIQSAMVRIPLHVDPYNPKSKGLPFLDKLIPWLPKQPGVGFPIALNGTVDKFVTTAQLDFSGTTISANVDYDAVIDPITMGPAKDGSIEFFAVETTDFLGRVFLCRDASTNDVLDVRMYSTASDILQWLQNHPGSVDACNVVVRESPFNNYPDFITSLASGVRLGITQGGGLGRVVDVTLFVPGQ